jgi:hypothetical protein
MTMERRGQPRQVTRRGFLLACSSAAVSAAGAAEPRSWPSLDREVGVTTGSFTKHLVKSPQPGKLRMLDLPRILREELDMRVLDLMTATLPSLEPAYLDRLRDAAGRAGCVLTNLKMNQRGLDMGSPNATTRRQALAEYKRTIDAAARLGVRWVRPLPVSTPPDPDVYAASYRELIDHAAPHGITLLIENFGWMEKDPDAIPRMIQVVGKGLAAQPDTGNWANNEVRYAGLTKAFPLAVSCDFKAKTMGPDGSHADYDLKRCFDLGWDAGFRGPWCLEHFHEDLTGLYREMALLRDGLRRWMAGKS